jgi:hypothetical protein
VIVVSGSSTRWADAENDHLAIYRYSDGTAAFTINFQTRSGSPVGRPNVTINGREAVCSNRAVVILGGPFVVTVAAPMDGVETDVLKEVAAGLEFENI